MIGAPEILIVLIGVGLVVALLVTGVRVLAGVGRRQRSRECPACGHLVKRGQTTCRCGYDFVAAAG